MVILPKAIVQFGLNLSAAVYTGIGVFGSVAESAPHFDPFQSPWSSLLFGAAALVCIRGIFYFGTLRDRIAAREAAGAKRAKRTAAAAARRAAIPPTAGIPVIVAGEAPRTGSP